MPESGDPKKKVKKAPPSTADILKKIRQKKNLQTKTSPKSTKTAKTSPKKTEQKKVKPKQPKPVQKETAKDEPKKPAPSFLEEPIEEKENESPPSFLDDTSAKPEEEKSNPKSSIPPRKKHKRFVSTKVIPKINYQRMKDLLFKRSFIQVIILVWLGSMCAFAIVWVINEFERKAEILRGVERGLTALVENKTDEATTIFRATLNQYKTYHIGYTKHLWFNDGQAEMAMMRMAQGWREMGEYEQGISCFKQVCLHDPFLTNPWMKETIRLQMLDYIDPTFWEQQELEQMYLHLLQDNPAEWEVGELLLPLMTEWVGMNINPLEKRLAQAGDVVYGLPVERVSENSFTINAEIFYKEIKDPQTITIMTPVRWNETANERLDWYLNYGRPCTFFCRIQDGVYVLDGIYSINLNDVYFMDAFQNAVDTYDFNS